MKKSLFILLVIACSTILVVGCGGGSSSSTTTDTTTVYGCMDATATNYNSAATVSDGSCTYPTTLDAEGISNTVLYDITTDGKLWGSILFNSDGTAVREMALTATPTDDIVGSWSFDSSGYLNYDTGHGETWNWKLISTTSERFEVCFSLNDTAPLDTCDTADEYLFFDLAAAQAFYDL